ncbi:cyclase [Actinoplanes sp. NBRC 14428]|uniref:Kynurenine formamidase n=1 Tax=Pseudosporangium ferrugineum TaxID=439699 RepID=A0A2T0SHR6_9ACTN|nr:cyclase family protein [Pseudosporangium ferrugineum]PRY32958.1 kynurenine formamidase [Pseudosporangium ferrugineum]BCJ49075.1 cyclase [Actinoplanes sp. NBRC 14428]
MCTEECLRQARTARVSRRAALLGAAAAGGGLALSAPASAAAPAAPLTGRRRGLQDLTYPLTTSFPSFADGEEARRRTYVTIEEDGYYMQEWRLVEHTGTHVDAPGHFTPGGRLSTELTLDELIVPAVVVDIAARAAGDPDAEVTVGDLRAFERRYGRIPRGAAVLMHSGWGAKVGSAAAYRGTDGDGVLHFPGFGADACEWLLEKRAVRSLGVDTLSIDPGRSEDFPVHVTLTGADRYGLENLANLASIPRHGATVVVGLLPFEEGSGGQARIFATW